MADYTGRSKPIQYLFQNGGGGGSCKVISGYYHNGSFYEDQSYTQIITGDTECLYIDLDTATLYLFDGTDYVEVQGGGGGAVSDGTVGVKISVTIGANSSVTYDWSDVGIDDWGSYLISMIGESAGYSQYYGLFARTAYLASSWAYSGLYAIRSSNANVSFSDSTQQITFSNTSSYAIVYEIEVLPLHPKVEIPKHTYSTTEQVVGTWIDGKPIYETTYDLGQDESVSCTAWFSTGITIANIERVINAQSISSGGTFYPVMVVCSNSNISIEACRDNAVIAVRYLTIQYTKSTT